MAARRHGQTSTAPLLSNAVFVAPTDIAEPYEGKATPPLTASQSLLILFPVSAEGLLTPGRGTSPEAPRCSLTSHSETLSIMSVCSQVKLRQLRPKWPSRAVSL